MSIVKKTAAVAAEKKVPARRGRPPKNAVEVEKAPAKRGRPAGKPAAKLAVKKAAAGKAPRAASPERADKMRQQIASLQAELKAAQAELKAGAKREKQLEDALAVLNIISKTAGRAAAAGVPKKKIAKKRAKKK